MTLVDTSVWIRAQACREPYRRELDRLLDRGEVAGHELVYGELLIGDNGSRAAILDTYARFRWARRVAHLEVVDFVRARNITGRGIGWVDAHLLASAVLEGWPLWTVDEGLAALAAEVGVAANRAF